MSEIEQRAGELFKVTPEMQDAWVDYDPAVEFSSVLNDLPRVSGAIRHAFYAGWMAALSPSPVTEGEVERVARAMWVEMGGKLFDTAPGAFADIYRRMARAALSAIRSLSPTREEGI